MAIGYVMPLDGQAALVNPIFADFIPGAGEIYSREGYDLLVSMVSDAAEAAYRPMAAPPQGGRGDMMARPSTIPVALLQDDLGLPFLAHGRTTGKTAAIAGSTSTSSAPSAARRSCCSTSGTGGSRCSTGRKRGFRPLPPRGLEEALAARGIAPNPARMPAPTEMMGIGGIARRCDAGVRVDPPTAFVASAMTRRSACSARAGSGACPRGATSRWSAMTTHLASSERRPPTHRSSPRRARQSGPPDDARRDAAEDDATRDRPSPPGVWDRH